MNSTFIENFYNPRRRHSSIGYLSPVAYEKNLLGPAACAPAIVLALQQVADLDRVACRNAGGDVADLLRQDQVEKRRMR